MILRELACAALRVIARYCRVRIDRSAIIHRTAIIGEDPQNYLWRHGWQSLQTNGGVRIAENVAIGPYTTVMRGVLGDTVIERGARIGHHCNIGHDVTIGEDSIIIAGTFIAGWTQVGKGCRIDMGVKVKNDVTIGDGARIGMGAVVLDNVPPGETWAGNPAHELKRYS